MLQYLFKILFKFALPILRIYEGRLERDVFFTTSSEITKKGTKKSGNLIKNKTKTNKKNIYSISTTSL